MARRNPEVTAATIVSLAIAAWASYYFFFKKPRVLAPDEYVMKQSACYEIATGKPAPLIRCEEQIP